MAFDSDRDLESEDMILGFEVGGYNRDYPVERGWRRMRGEKGVGAQKLG